MENSYQSLVAKHPCVPRQRLPRDEKPAAGDDDDDETEKISLFEWKRQIEIRAALLKI